MRFLKWFRKPKTKITESKKESKESLEELIKRRDIEELYLKDIAYKNRGEISKHEYRDLEKIEERIISLLPDDFQRAVFKILSRYKFDIVAFIKGEDWKKDFFQICRDICHFLYWGSPYPMKQERTKLLPFSGEDFFLWFLAQAKNREGKDCLGNILDAISEATDKENKTIKILGHEFKEEQLNSIGGRIISVFFGGWGKKPAVLIDIFCEVEGGEEFIKKILDDIRKERQNKGGLSGKAK